MKVRLSSHLLPNGILSGGLTCARCCWCPTTLGVCGARRRVHCGLSSAMRAIPGQVVTRSSVLQASIHIILGQPEPGSKTLRGEASSPARKGANTWTPRERCFLSGLSRGGTEYVSKFRVCVSRMSEWAQARMHVMRLQLQDRTEVLRSSASSCSAELQKTGMQTHTVGCQSPPKLCNLYTCRLRRVEDTRN